MRDPLAEPSEDGRWPAEEPQGCIGYAVRFVVFAAVLVLMVTAVLVVAGCGRDDRILRATTWPHPSNLVRPVDGLASPLDSAEVAFADGWRSPAPPPPAPRNPNAYRRNRLLAVRASRSRPAVPIGACSGWAHLVARHPWPVGTACAVLACESGGNPNARNRRSSATGLFQILGGPIDPAANVAQAYAMYTKRGWQPWNASRSCWT